MIILLSNFHDSLDIALILAPDGKFFSAKCVQFPLKFAEWNLNEGHCCSGTIIIHFLDKPFQEINLKIHLNKVPLCK